MNMDKFNKNDSNKVITRGQLKLTIITSILNFITIIVIFYENKNKMQNKLSYLLFCGTFLLMGINQYIYYKNMQKKKYLFYSIVYFVVFIFLAIYSITKFI